MLIALALLHVGARVDEAAADKLHADRLFATDRVLEVKIRLSNNDWQALRNQSREAREAFENPLDKPYSYFKGDITIDGVTIRNVGVRKKGFIGSQDTFRPSLKVKFTEWVDQRPVEGLDRLTLNNNKQDRALVSQYLTYRLFRKSGIHAPRCSFAAVTVNGEYLGVYSHVESIKKPFLNNAFSDDSGRLYEGTLTDFYPRAIERFEAKTSAADKDRSRLLKLAELVNADEGADIDEIAKLMDVDYFLKFWAIESLIGFWDGYTQNQNNFFVYDSPSHAKFYFIPWGADSCFSRRRPHFARATEGGSIAVHARSLLAHALYHVDGIPQRYRTALETILTESWDEEEMLREVDRIEALVFDHIDFLQLSSILAMDDMRSFIRERRSEVLDDLEGNWPAVITEPPRKPAYTVAVGSAVGNFSTRFNIDDEQQDSSEASVTAILDEESLEFGSIAVQAQPANQYGRSDATPSTAITFTATRQDAPSMVFSLIVPNDAFSPSEGNSVEVSGSFHGRDIEGTIQFDQAGTTIRDPVVGAFELKILETRGGRWGRR